MRALVWAAAILLAIAGIVSVIARMLFPSDLAIRAEPVRLAVMERFDRADPSYAQRLDAVRRFEGRYAAHPATVYVHVIAGGLFLLLAPLQFSSSLRRRFARAHRWIGRTLLLAAVPATITGFRLGVTMPIAGAGEAAIIALVAAFFAFSLSRAFLAIRRGDVTAHREWMIRACGVALGASVVRLAAAALDFTLTPHGFPLTRLFVFALWSGWLVTVLGAELWIRCTRESVISSPSNAYRGTRGWLRTRRSGSSSW